MIQASIRQLNYAFRREFYSSIKLRRRYGEWKAVTFSSVHNGNNDHYGYEKQRWKHSRVFYAGAIWTTIASTLGLKRPLLDDDEIKHNIKLSLISISEKKFDEAELTLHQTLQMANSRQNESAANYVLDLMANMYYQIEKYEEAIQIFTELMRRLMMNGMKKEDPAMIEISLKLADMYARTGDDERADVGFRFCVDTASKNLENLESEHETASIRFRNVKNMEDDYGTKGRFTDTYALYGMVLETYGQYLITRNRWEEAEEHINKCLEMSNFVYGSTRPHSIILLNNFAILLLDVAKFEKARHYFNEVVNRATHIDDLTEQLPEMMCNFAEALWHTGDREKALEQAKQAVHLAEELDNEQMLSRTKRYLDSLTSDKTTVAQGRKS